MRGIGIASGIIAYGIVTYYMAILGWGNVMLVKSFYKELPWDIHNLVGGFNNSDELLAKPAGHFVNQVLMDPENKDEPEVASAGVLFGSVFMWFVVWLILVKGQNFISKAVWVTVLLPVVMLVILVVVGITLPGAGDGIKQYIGRWDLSELSNGEMWVDAFGQIFFSLSLSTGVMTAFASFNPRNSNIVKDAAIVAISNCLFSFCAGFAVFSIAGFFVNETGFSYEDVGGYLGGGSLAFIAYPAGLSLVPGPYVRNFLSALFFITFFFLGVDSAFSLVEGTVHSFAETVYFSKYSRFELTTLVCVTGMVVTLPYTLDIGNVILDIVDSYVASLGLLFVGLLECLAAGWMYKKGDLIEKVGAPAVYVFDGFVLLGFLLLSILGVALPYADVSPGATAGAALGAMIGCFAIAIIGGGSLARNCDGFSDALYHLAFSGPDHLRKLMNAVITEGAPNNWKFSYYWIICVKYIATGTLLFLLIIRMDTYRATKGAFGDKWPYAYLQVIGVLSFAIVFLGWLIGYLFPNFYRDPKHEVLQE
mmetsp:Transcript_1571/g.4882  ORF Transcript_1571/g.4882 Transcript_1571/m.4882 type:complete len:535 (-) Transcript_1571:136-1740(-)